MNIGSKIKSVREAKKMTQEELGIACGTTKQTIFKYETGVVTNIPLDRVEKIADVLGVSPAYLLGWEQPSDLFAEKPPTLTVKDERDDSMETKLVELYRELNEEGQEKLVDYAEDLVAGGRYIKSDQVIMDKEA